VFITLLAYLVALLIINTIFCIRLLQLKILSLLPVFVMSQSDLLYEIKKSIQWFLKCLAIHQINEINSTLQNPTFLK